MQTKRGIICNLLLGPPKRAKKSYLFSVVRQTSFKYILMYFHFVLSLPKLHLITILIHCSLHSQRLLHCIKNVAFLFCEVFALSHFRSTTENRKPKKQKTEHPESYGSWPARNARFPLFFHAFWRFPGNHMKSYEII